MQSGSREAGKHEGSQMGCGRVSCLCGRTRGQRGRDSGVWSVGSEVWGKRCRKAGVSCELRHEPAARRGKTARPRGRSFAKPHMRTRRRMALGFGFRVEDKGKGLGSRRSRFRVERSPHLARGHVIAGVLLLSVGLCIQAAVALRDLVDCAGSVGAVDVSYVAFASMQPHHNQADCAASVGRRDGSQGCVMKCGRVWAPPTHAECGRGAVNVKRSGSEVYEQETRRVMKDAMSVDTRLHDNTRTSVLTFQLPFPCTRPQTPKPQTWQV
eukprot:355261-Chlamydomonas_euryale.AAC.2